VEGLTRRKEQLKMGKRKGLTLIEVLIALAILGIVSVGITLGLRNAINGAASTDSRETAKNIAETQMEYIKQSKYSTEYSLYTPTPLPDYWNHYVTNIAIDRVEGNPNVNIQKITITVSYPDYYQEGSAELVLEDFKVNN
jgi:prepilin-type N-terminal cleavage/methylation domain-containing protein